MHQRLGSRVGPRIAKVTVDAMADYQKRTRHERARTEAEAQHMFWRDISRERDAHASPLLRLLLGHDGTPAEVEHLLRFMHSGRGELAGMLAERTLGTASAQGIGAGLAVLLAPLNHALLHSHPYILLAVNDTVQAWQTGIMSAGAAVDEIAGNGINTQRADILRELAVTHPDLASALELWRRGFAQEADVIFWLRRAGFEDITARNMLHLRQTLLTPADAALAVLRGNLTHEQGVKIAEQNGIDAGDFDTLTLNTGEPPGLMQLLEAFRRGFIDKDVLERGIRQSRVRNEWIPTVERLRHVPASTSDAIQGVIKGHIPETRARTIADHNGLDPSEFDWLLASSGNPIANVQALTLLNRGQMPRSRVAQAIREGRTKDEYINDIINLAVKYPPAFQVVRMVTSGAISEKRAADILLKEGYPKDVAEGLVHSASTAQAAKPKALALAKVEALYEELAIDEAQAIKYMRALGYSEANAKLALRVADLKRKHAFIQAAIAPVRASYTARHITETEASQLLDKLRIPPAQRDLLLALWAIDREAKKVPLTPAQIIRANERGLLPDHDAEQRLVDHGYTLGDARILLDLEKRRTQPAP